jgi:hypothetical protein
MDFELIPEMEFNDKIGGSLELPKWGKIKLSMSSGSADENG